MWSTWHCGPSDSLARVHEDRTLAASWRDRERQQLAAPEHALHRRVEGRGELEVHVPAAGPRAEGNGGAGRAVVRGLEQHPVQRLGC